MAMGRPKAALVLRPQQREQLESLANSRSLPAGLVRLTDLSLYGTPISSGSAASQSRRNGTSISPMQFTSGAEMLLWSTP